MESMSPQIDTQKQEVEKQKEVEKKELFARTAIYINAGGRGTRMESVFEKGDHGVTKALIDFNDKPMVQNHVNLLRELGFGNIIVGAGDHLNIK